MPVLDSVLEAVFGEISDKNEARELAAYNDAEVAAVTVPVELFNDHS